MTGIERRETGYRNLFTQPRMVQDLIRGFLREDWSAWLDLATLERSLGAERLLDVLDGPLVWRARWQGGSAWLYLLLACREEEDPGVALRMELCRALLYEGLLRHRPVGARPWLPVAIPVILYRGSGRWTAPLEALELFQPLLPALQRHAPRGRCLLLDAAHDPLPPDGDNLVSLLCGLERSPTSQAALPFLKRLAATMEGPENAGLRRTWGAFLGEWLAERDQPAGGVPAPTETV